MKHTVLIAFIALVLMIVSAMVNGWALSILWGWFIVPVFGLPKISIVQAAGINLLATTIVAQRPKDDEDDPKLSLAKDFLFSILHPFLALMLGYVVHLFM